MPQLFVPEPTDKDRNALIDDPGILELILTEAATDRDVLFLFQNLIKNYPYGPWAMYAGRLCIALQKSVDDFYYRNIG